MYKFFFSLVLILYFNTLCYGNIYVWVDENGISHFSNIAPATNYSVEEFEESNTVFKGHKFKVLHVYDGDTIKVEGLDLKFKIRLVGIDCPETGYGDKKDQPFSQKAKRYLKDLLNNKTVGMKSYGTGGYNRQLAEVFVNGKNINLEMVRVGLAEVYKGRRPKTFDSKKYLKEESRAKKSKKGMWSQGNSYISPKQWRKDHPRK